MAKKKKLMSITSKEKCQLWMHYRLTVARLLWDDRDFQFFQAIRTSENCGFTVVIDTLLWSPVCSVDSAPTSYGQVGISSVLEV